MPAFIKNRSSLLLAAILAASCGPGNIKIDVSCAGHGDRSAGFLDCLWGSNANDAGIASGGASSAGGASGSGGLGDGGPGSGGLGAGGAGSGGLGSGGAGAGGAADSGGAQGSGGVSSAGGAGSGGAGSGGSGAGGAQPTQLQKFQSHVAHVVVLYLENRSFDHFFGTYPGADGLPTDQQGAFTSCNPDPRSNNVCARPYHNTLDANVGGPHTSTTTIAAIHGGLMDQFVKESELGNQNCSDPNNPVCSNGTLIDTMGFHDATEVGKLWAYADAFTLQDHVFPSNTGYSLSTHLQLWSGWSAQCTSATDPATCVSKLDQASTETRWAWTDLTQLMFEHGVSWRSYLGKGATPSCNAAQGECPPCSTGVSPCNGTNSVLVGKAIQQIWNPLPTFATVNANGQLGNIQDLEAYYQATPATGAGCSLPSYSVIVPADAVSHHPANLVSRGQKFIVGLVNRLGHSDCWGSTALFVTWDEYGGFFDHYPPPSGWGVRVPQLLISSWARAGYVDHAMYSHDSYARLVEDAFLGGERLDPTTLRRPDPRPSVSENDPRSGDLTEVFDFDSPPRPPLFLVQ